MTKTQRVLIGVTWLIAAGVLSVSTVEAQRLLHAHGFTAWASWVLPLCVDLALAVALVADQALAGDDDAASWGTVLRWFTAASTVVLNTLSPLMAAQWVTAVLHAIAPALLFVVVEASTSYQRRLAVVARNATDGADDPLLDTVAQAHRALSNGRPATRKAVAEHLRCAGISVANGRLSAMLRTVRDQSGDGSDRG